MRMLQDMLDEQLRDEYFVRRIIAKAILSRLQRLGFRIGDELLAVIASKLDRPDLASVRLEFTDDQVPNNLLAPSTTEDSPDLELKLEGLDEEVDDIVKQFGEEMTRFIPDIVREISPVILCDLQRRARSMLRSRGKRRKSHERGLKKTWGRPIDLLDMLLAVCLEAGDDFNDGRRESDPEDRSYVVDALTRLHARACQIASEILALLRSGHADGAHARWRCLHEIAVVGFFITSFGEDVAERYLLHDAVECYKGAKEYQKHSCVLGFEPLTNETLADIAAARNALVSCF
jgi:hypothetical protein